MIAQSLIKIKGTYDKNKWDEKKLKNYVKTKILKEINSFYHADLELFAAENGNVEVWVYISIVPERALIKLWLGKHITEEGLEVKGYEIKALANKNGIIII